MFGIQQTLSAVLEEMATANESGEPLPIRVEFCPLVAVVEQDRPCCCIRHGNGIREDPGHTCVRVEGLTLSNTNRRKQTHDLWVNKVLHECPEEDKQGVGARLGDKISLGGQIA